LPQALLQLHYGGGYTVDYSPSEFSFYKENGFDRIKAINFALIGEPGTPELPAVYLNYIIPPYAKVESLIVSQSNINQIYGAYLVYPAQPPRIIGESIPWVGPDSLIYNSDVLFPGEFVRIVSQGVMDGARIVTIEVRPLQYRPKSRRLYLVRNITIEFSFGPNTMPELRPQIRGKCEQVVYDAVIRNVVENDNEIPLYYQTPILVEENQIGTLAPIPGAPGVIITPTEFVGAFQEYANWMTDQGIRTILITPEYIYSAFPNGRDNPEKIRLYIQWCYKHAGGTYFILGGDDYFVPTRYCWSRYTEPLPDSNFSVPCDMYFSDLTDEWDKNSNGKWGELEYNEGDRFPEVFVGRVTSYCVQEVDNWVDKVLGYEKSPNLIDSYALWLYKDMAIGDAYTVFPPHFNGHHLFIEVNDAEQAVEYLSHGYAFNSIHCHGVREYFCDYPATTKVWAYWLGSPSPNNDGLNNLENFNKYIFVYSLACHNGGYDSHWINPGTPGEIAPTDTCIADGFTDTYNNSIGACSFLGYTRATRLSYSYDLEYEFYNCLFSPYTGPYPPEPAVTRLGVAEALSKCGGRIDWMDDSDRHNCYAHNHFGSPYTEAWTNQPGHFTVAHMRSIYVGVQYQFRVTVRDAQTGAYVAYAKVCLNKPDDIYEVGYTNENGQVDFFISAQSTGEIKVTVTRVHDNNTYIQYLPSETSCEVRGVAGGPQGSDMEQILPDKLSITGIPTFAKENLLLNFGVSNNDNVTISVYDAAGTKVRNLIKADIVPGYYQEKIDTRDLSSGVYFVVLKQDNRKVSRKFLLIK
jgi:hypothetical protein